MALNRRKHNGAAKLPALRQALQGRVQPYHLSLITRVLAHIDFLEESLAQL
jgi:hypothetical protein